MDIIIGKEDNNKNCRWTITQRLCPYSISENESSFRADVYGCRVKIMKTNKEGQLLSKLINEKRSITIIDKKIKEWVLKKISVKDLDNFIFDECVKNFEQGKKHIQTEMKKILGIYDYGGIKYSNL